MDEETGMAAAAAAVAAPQKASAESAFDAWWRETGKTVAVGMIISAVWFLAFAVYITAAIGWRQLFTLLPDQFGSFMATLVLPLAFLWLVIAYLDRGRELRREAAQMRAYLAQLTYPASQAEGRINTIADSLKAQSRALVDASETAIRNMQKLQNGFLRDTEKLASVTGQLEAGAGSAASAVDGPSRQAADGDRFRRRREPQDRRRPAPPA